MMLKCKITKCKINTSPWRTILVPDTFTFGQLHELLIILFDWDPDINHRFLHGDDRNSKAPSNNEITNDEDQSKIKEHFIRNNVMFYEIDESRVNVLIKLENSSIPAEQGVFYPIVLRGKGVMNFDNNEYESGRKSHNMNRMDKNKLNGRIRKRFGKRYIKTISDDENEDSENETEMDQCYEYFDVDAFINDKK
ncbi:hypothetical protein O9G_004558 [Rozella allomycis CSF55]|uniref:Plasmid pRiA4b Orf3-like domain-containing protein n=1 Tax=Rozella allomycis (strain CSF55) TaxID=988480 RepID=A0A075AQT0_ROZAC|nr:hypothetical protein O9G_004558 [Rozella allomycis CSF55]|eukprot:EPZ32606.1 hypothetical protein O9G_004558 [Rozella allomycis CSF55]